MSRIRYVRQAATPSAPPAGQVRTFINDATGRWASIDEFGDVTNYVGTTDMEVVTEARNETGSAIGAFVPVAAVGYSVPEGRVLVAPADNTNPALRPAIGITKAIIPDATNFDALSVGRLDGVDTSAYGLTDQLVLGIGDFSRPPPDEDPFTGEIQPLGVVSRVHATEGIIDANVQGLNSVNGAQVFYTLEAVQTGLVSGGEVTKGAGLTVDVAAGVGFISDGGVLTRVVWGAAPGLVVGANTTFRAQVDENGVVSIAGTGYPSNRVILAFGLTDASEVIALTHHALQLTQLGLQFHNYGRDAIGPVNVSGQVATINGGTGLDINVTAGTFYIDVHRLTSVGGSPITFRYWHQDGLGGWTTTDGHTVVDPSLYDDGSGVLAAVPAGQFKRDLLMCTVNDGGTEYHVFYGQTLYLSQAAAEAGTNPNILTFMNANCVRVAAIVQQEGNANIVSILDQRPRVGQFAADSGGGDHATLADLEWTVSGHTASVPDTFATFGPAGEATLTPVANYALKSYVDALVQGFDVKASCRVVSNTNLALSGLPTIDGVAVVAGDRVLAIGQTAPQDNGIYVAAAGAWARATDADASADVTAGMYTFISEGTTFADSGFVLTTNDPIVLGTTPLVFTQFNALGQIIAGNALSKTGNQLDVNVDNSTIEISSDALRVKALGITDAHVAAANKDGTTVTPSLRTLGTGAQQAAPGNDARFGNHVAWGQGSVASTTVTRYLSPGFDPTLAPTSRVAWIAPVAGTIDLLRVLHDIAGGNANAIVYTVRKNGTPQTVTVSVPATTVTVVSDTSNSFTVAAGDRIDIEVTKAASVGTSPTNISATFRFTPS